MGVLDRSEEGNVRILTLNRPQARNAMNLEVLERLHAELASAHADQVRCLLIRGEGVDFTAGGDMKEAAGADASYNDRYHSLFVGVVRSLYTLPRPTIAMVQGNAVGAGLELALACDFRFVGTSAKFRVGYDKLAGPPEAIAHIVLPRLLGIDRAKRFVFTGERWSGEDAYRYGMATELFPDEKLGAETLTFAQTLAVGPTFSFGLGKELMDRSYERSLDENLDAVRAASQAAVKSEDYAEVVRAMEENRAPVFPGR
jgi:2-(1,2-epoxy-1,2-dihydrophenyl)acetyl-CoA isomerase